jgi:hypothetical protein
MSLRVCTSLSKTKQKQRWKSCFGFCLWAFPTTFTSLLFGILLVGIANHRSPNYFLLSIYNLTFMHEWWVGWLSMAWQQGHKWQFERERERLWAARSTGLTWSSSIHTDPLNIPVSLRVLHVKNAISPQFH